MGEGNARIYNGGDRIDYAVVLSNFGGWYNPKFSEFTCPVDGIYMFIAASFGPPGYLACINIMVNGVRVVTSYADGRSSGDYGHATNMVVTECLQGQKVWLRADRDIRAHDTTNNYNTFSGLILHRY